VRGVCLGGRVVVVMVREKFMNTGWVCLVFWDLGALKKTWRVVRLPPLLVYDYDYGWS
jgi:hypothetical protein